MLNLYKKHHIAKGYTSIGLFREIKKQFPIEKVFYPGCYVHITPSLVFPDVTYADSYRNTDYFFESPEVLEYINQNKEYSEETSLKFYKQDYHKPFKELPETFDLVISQYAGFVGQGVKTYIKKGGILVCNNSHGDASMASIDPDYRLIAFYNRKSDEKFYISSTSLGNYLIPKNGKPSSKEELLKTMKGTAYTKSPSGYVFRKAF